MARKPQPKKAESLLKRQPLAETIAAGAGLALTLLVLGYSVWQGATGNGALPELTVVQAGARGGLVEIEVRNSGAGAAAAVEVEGVLTRGGAEVERARAHFDYVPGKGKAEGGLIFGEDPASGELALSVKGFAKP